MTGVLLGADLGTSGLKVVVRPSAAWRGRGCGVLGLTPVELFDAAATVPTGAGGVVFRPFLTGERGGVAGPADRGGWTGLPASTTRAELARAAVEGVVSRSRPPRTCSAGMARW